MQDHRDAGQASDAGAEAGGARRANRPPNRLARESSPYLLQHAHNPVDWFAWGEEAFAEARRRDVPIFLSIGYSTCYWCHVMERECFEDEAIGHALSESFVCVKVDREERPDVDDVYMAAVLMIRGNGGWPLNCFLEPGELKPFWAGTYIPPEPRFNLPGLPQLIDGIRDAWLGKREAVMKQAETVAEAIREHVSRIEQPVPLGEKVVSTAVSALLQSHDRTLGGFGSAPKFPQPAFLDFLLDVLPAAGDDSTADAITQAIKHTLNAMSAGGIFDHVGGGFHRYSVDATWTVPHFEKMLYDNAQLARTYARAASLFGDEEYRHVLRRTLDYVLREMTGHEGSGFWSAQDAEVDHREGLNYLWTKEELERVLSPEDAKLALRLYGVEKGPNFQDPHHPEEPMRSVLRLQTRLDRLAPSFDMDVPRFRARVSELNQTLLAARSQRKQPGLDDKVLTSWNGLMIGAMARGYAELDDTRYLDAARAAAASILTLHVDAQGDLLRVSRHGVAKGPAFLEDYAFLIEGLLALARVDTKQRTALIGTASRLAMRAHELFADASGRLFDARAGASELFVRTASTHDGAIPSGTSVMIHNWIELSELTKDPRCLERAGGALEAISASISENPTSSINAVRAVLRLLLAGVALSDSANHATGEPSLAATTAGTDPERVVEVFATQERVQVSQETPGILELRVRIAPGYHVNAAIPGPSATSLIPFRVGLTGVPIAGPGAGESGSGGSLSVFADYPEGELLSPQSANADAIRVYRGEVDIKVVLELTGPWPMRTKASGVREPARPLLIVTYQACTETECLPPRTLELDVAIDPG
ncbi:MAG: thioredoxin domain-containing protein [Planctomycetota bacterium]|nr:thioredoxin domain-containing protein [Planctomycetota bacterium]